jgi:DNA polymerase-3 subunit delta'
MFPWFNDVFHSFTSRYLANKLHHALLLSGASGIGKYRLAQELGSALLCKAPTELGACETCSSCLLRIAGNHPDLYILESEKQLGVDKIREGIAKLSGTAQMSGNKVLLIPNADTMTEAAANALLKTLEEPTANTYLLLITSSVTKLMPTILSRCEKHALPLPSLALSLNYLRENGVEDASEALLSAYGNAPLRAEAALKGEEEFSFRIFNDDFQALLAGDANSQAHRLAKKWQDNAVLAAQWCMQKAHGDYIASQQPSDYTRYAQCVDVVKTLQHPGVNRSMVLFGMLKLFQR